MVKYRHHWCFLNCIMRFTILGLVHLLECDDQRDTTLRKWTLKMCAFFHKHSHWHPSECVTYQEKRSVFNSFSYMHKYTQPSPNLCRFYCSKQIMKVYLPAPKINRLKPELLMLTKHAFQWKLNTNGRSNKNMSCSNIVGNITVSLKWFYGHWKCNKCWLNIQPLIVSSPHIYS